MYSDIEAQVQSLLQGLTGSFASHAQVTRGDWGILDAGVDTSAVLYPGAFEETGYAAANTVGRIWTVHLDLFQRVEATNAAAILSFVTLRDAVLTHLQKYPKLNALTVGGAPFVGAVLGLSGDEPIFVGADEESGPFAIKQTFDLRILEESTVTSLD